MAWDHSVLHENAMCLQSAFSVCKRQETSSEVWNEWRANRWGEKAWSTCRAFSACSLKCLAWMFEKQMQPFRQSMCQELASDSMLTMRGHQEHAPGSLRLYSCKAFQQNSSEPLGLKQKPRVWSDMPRVTHMTQAFFTMLGSAVLWLAAHVRPTLWGPVVCS